MARGYRGGSSMARFFALLFGVAGALFGSQAPGFTLQYMQNLAGRIDELKPIVAEFDAAVTGHGYTRDAALAECERSSGLLDALCGGYQTTIRRYEELSAHYDALKAASDFSRPLLLARTFKRDIAESAWKEFNPAIPASTDGALYAGGGFAALWGGLSLLFGVIGSMFGMNAGA